MRQSDNSEATPTLRLIEATDVAFLTDLWAASWQETLPAIDFADRRAWLAAFLADPAHRTLVACGPDGLLGFATFQGTYLHQLVVSPHAKGSGVATRLLADVKEAAATKVSLDVNQANGRAVRFYQREGFVIVGAGVNRDSGLATWRMHWAPP